MFDFSKVEYIELDYVYKKYNEIYSYSETDNKPTLSADERFIRFEIKDDDSANDDSTYQIVLEKGTEKIRVKGDFFTTPNEWYETTITFTKELALIISEDASEKMELRCYLV